MTVATQSSKVVGRGNGAATAFPFSFEIPDANSVQISHVSALGVVTVLTTAQYGISGLGDPAGGTVTYPLSGSPMATGESIVIARNVPLTQPTSLLNQGGYYPRVVEDALDRLEMQIQQVANGGQNYPLALTFPAVDVDPETELPPAAARAGLFMAFDGSGNPTFLPSTGLPGDLSPYTTIPTGGTTARSFASRFADMWNVKDSGAKGDGITDDTAAIQAAIDLVALVNGGGIYFPPGGYVVSSALTLKSKVMLWGARGAQLLWFGVPGGNMITSSTTAILSEAGVKGLAFTCGLAGKVLELNSPFRCTFSDLAIFSNSTTNILIDLLCNTAGAVNLDTNRNAVYNYFENIIQTGTCGTMLRLRGNSAVPGQVVTLNTFVHLNAQGGCRVRGIDFSRWADSNAFTGMMRFLMTGAGSVGVEFNSDSPAVDTGVYDNVFQYVAIDTFGTGLGRWGVKHNAGNKQNVIDVLFNEPEAENGAFVHSLDYGYRMTRTISGSNFMHHILNGHYLAIGAATSQKYSLYTTHFNLVGTNQAGIVLADTFNTEAAGSSGSGLTVAQATLAAAWTLTSYYGVNVQDIVKGAGSTVTNQIGHYCANLTAGTNNFGYYHDIAAGASKWGFYGAGTAANYMDGGLAVRAGAAAAVTGFINISAANGIPVGVPQTFSGNVPLYFDTATNKLWAYNGAWVGVVLS